MPSVLNQRLSRLIAPFFAALPTSCVLCGAAGKLAICDGCNSQFFSRHLQRCLQCAIPLPPLDNKVVDKCGECMRHQPAFDATIVAADYVPPIDQLVLALKFRGRLALAPLFAHMLRKSVLQSHENLPILLAAVPLGAERLAQRGFNQALEIARPLSRMLGIELNYRLAVRVRDTAAQTLLHPDERSKNIRNAFTVGSKSIACIQGRHIGLVDDVLTTGETLNELAATLKRFGASRVTNFVFARTLK